MLKLKTNKDYGSWAFSPWTLGVFFLFYSLVLVAAPQLSPQAELVVHGELKAKILARAKGVPPVSAQAHYFTMTRGGETKKLKKYSVAELWRLRAEAGTWKDPKGNVMRIVRVLSLVPTELGELAEKDEIDKALDDAEKSFEATDEQLKHWEMEWLAGREENSTGDFRVLKNGARYYVDFEFAEPVKEQDAKKLLKNAIASLSSTTGAVSKNNTSMKWWEEDGPQYKFMTNLDRAKGGKFLKDAMGLMSAMRKAYEFYVPPQKPVGKCTVRVFKTLEDYQEYLAGTSSDELMFSCGLWDPSREELLISAADVENAQKTMRHEAFHQYLFYATGGSRHAIWFNEGHACFFENVKYNPAKKIVDILDNGNRAMWVAKNPEAVAQEIQRIIRYSRS